MNTFIQTHNVPSLIQKPIMERAFKDLVISTDGIEISIQPLLLHVDKSYSFPNNQLALNLWFEYFIFLKSKDL